MDEKARWFVWHHNGSLWWCRSMRISRYIQAYNLTCFSCSSCFFSIWDFFMFSACFLLEYHVFVKLWQNIFLNNKIELILDNYSTVQSPLTFILPFSLVKLSVLLILFLCMLLSYCNSFILSSRLVKCK